MNIEQHYQQLLQEKHLCKDEQQQQAVTALQTLYEQILRRDSLRRLPWFRRVVHRPEKFQGLYIWGGTGRGKTFLMDMFYECLPGSARHRVHFHHFMLDVHEQLRDLPKSPDPLEVIAEQMSRRFCVLCLDEFHVHDIADAMLMAGLLDAMFRRGIVLVATSNIAIDDLYANGLQREKFLPAIELLKSSTREIDLQAGVDYRFMEMEKTDTYRLLNGSDSDNFLEERMEKLSPCSSKTGRTIEINDRQIRYRALADDVIWFDFDEICRTPRSAMDYIEIAEQFHTVLIGGLPVLQERDDSAAKRFIHLIDALYDHRVKLVVTAEALPEKLYQASRFQFAFTRTASRLTEMATEKYLMLPHKVER